MWCAQSGIQKLLVKNDIDKLKGPCSMDKLKQSEELLKASWSIVTQHSDSHHSYKCFGRLCTRCILYLVGKQKFSRESKVFETLESMVELFTQEMSNTTMQQAQQPKEDQKPMDVLHANPRQVALLQNGHIKLGQQHLGFIKCSPAWWHCINDFSIHAVLAILVFDQGTKCKKITLAWSLPALP